MEIIGREGQRAAHSADRVEFRKQEADGVDADAVASMRLRLRWCMSRGDVRRWKADVGRQNRPEKKETDIEQNTGHIVVRSRAGLGRRDRLRFPRTPTDEAPTRHACSLRTCWSFLLHIIYVGPALAWPCDPPLGYGSRYPRGVRPDAPGGVSGSCGRHDFAFRARCEGQDQAGAVGWSGSCGRHESRLAHRECDVDGGGRDTETWIQEDRDCPEEGTACSAEIDRVEFREQQDDGADAVRSIHI
ncbi:hypothetical protein K438DRAFT_1764955 [Mycena galopus ATCC 62051]|nr:hypothetical protein K438DRAFT_1764955 [Mycena galopus ATCC 62051]